MTVLDHAPKSSNKANGYTAFVVQHKSWGLGLADRPDVLFEFRPPDNYCRPDPEYLKVNDHGLDNKERYAIDVDGIPILDWSDMPLICSPSIEGWRLEAIMRLNHGCVYRDFRQRMIPEDGKRVKEHTLQMRTLRARQKYRMISWQDRKSSSTFDEQILREMTPEMRAKTSLRNNISCLMKSPTSPTLRELAKMQ